jgi:hypothetical protein
MELRPTQATVGLVEVARKRAEWRERTKSDRAAFLGRHLIPTVLGPKGRPYVIDHHHLARALHDEGATEILTSVAADLSALSKDSFWRFLDNRSWCHPYDAEGERRGFEVIPKTIADLADDPYRSLAGALRRAGGYAKDLAPFAEFLWADFLRSRLGKRAVSKDFDAAVSRAVKLARSRDADFLPGWCGAE